MPRSNLGWILGISAAVLLGYTVSHSAPPAGRDKDYELVRLLVDVLEEVDHKYVRPLDADMKRKLVEEMVNGGLERLDPHSTYINSQEYRRFTLNNKGKFGGVGIQISNDRVPIPGERKEGRYLWIMSPMVDTPAYDAGVLPGDVITKIDGKSTENMRVSEAIDLIQGEPGSSIVLTVMHKGSKTPVDLEMKRAEIHVQSVLGDRRQKDNPAAWDYIVDTKDKIGYVRIIQFNETTTADVRNVLESLKKQGTRGLILDLRTNPGGLLRSAVDVSRMFLKEGRIVSTKGRNQQEETYDAKPETTILSAEECPMVVLVDDLSASASEIVAAALQDHKRAVIIGERSYGKGSVQNIIEMEKNTSALKLTTASYWRPSGKNIHRYPDSKEQDDWGVRPDKGFEVTLKDDERQNYHKYRLQRDVVPGKKPPTITGDAKEDDKSDKSMDKAKPFVDRPMEKALAYLREELQKRSGKSVTAQSQAK